jgi:hypothetical protein
MEEFQLIVSSGVMPNVRPWQIAFEVVRIRPALIPLVRGRDENFPDERQQAEGEEEETHQYSALMPVAVVPTFQILVMSMDLLVLAGRV